MTTHTTVADTGLRCASGAWRLERVSAALAALAVLAAVVLQVTHVSQTDLFLTVNARAADLMPGAFWLSATLLGDTVVAFCLMAPLLLWRAQIVLALFAAVPLGGLASVALKHFFAAPRPGLVLDPATFHVVGGLLTSYNSFPSGHTITAFAAAGAFCACVWRVPCVGHSDASVSRQGMTRGAATRVGWGALLVAALVGVSRIAVGAHWPWDVLGGAGVGWLAGLGGAWLTRRHAARFQSNRVMWGALWVLFACSLGLLQRAHEEASGTGVFVLAALCVWSVLIAKVWRSMPFRYDGFTSQD